MPELKTAHWEACKKHLRDRVPEPFFNTFIEPLTALQTEASTVSLVVPEERLKHHIEMRYGSLLKEAVLKHFPGQVSLVRIQGRDECDPVNSDLVVSVAPSVAAPSFQWDSSFLPHQAVREDLEALVRMRHSFRPIFLTGGSGSGKTVFARRWVAHASTQARATVLGMQDLLTGFVNSIKSHSTMEWKEGLRANHLLIIDDLQLLKPSAARCQEELRNLIDDFEKEERILVFLSDREPSRLTLNRDLKSRLILSQQLHLLYPDLDTRRQILVDALAADNLELREELIDHLARRIPQDVRLLRAAVHRLRFQGTDPKRMSREELDRLCDQLYQTDDGHVQPEQILEAVASFFRVTVDEIRGPGKEKRIAMARHIASYLCSKMTSLTLSEIARVTNRKDHTGVLYALNRLEKLLSQDLFLHRQIEEIRDRLLSSSRPG